MEKVCVAEEEDVRRRCTPGGGRAGVSPLAAEEHCKRRQLRHSHRAALLGLCLLWADYRVSFSTPDLP